MTCESHLARGEAAEAMREIEGALADLPDDKSTLPAWAEIQALAERARQ